MNIGSRGGEGGRRSSIASGLGRESLGGGLRLGLGQGVEGEEAGGEGGVDNDVCVSSLLEVLRQRADDERPLVRAKALQAFGLALSLRWPKFTVPLAPWEGERTTTTTSTTASAMMTKLTSAKVVHDVTSMLITSEDVSVFFDRCAGMTRRLYNEGYNLTGNYLIMIIIFDWGF